MPISSNLSDYFTFDGTPGSGVFIGKCKLCDKIVAFLESDKAATVRALNHGLSHGGVHLMIKPLVQKP